MSNCEREGINKCNPEIIRVGTNIVVNDAEKRGSKSECATTLNQVSIVVWSRCLDGKEMLTPARARPAATIVPMKAGLVK